MNQKQPGEATSGIEPETKREEKEDIAQVLAEEKEKAENYLANWQRVQADFINYKRRSEQEKEELSQFTKSVFVLGFLSVLDDLERALDSIPPELDGNNWVDGVRLIENKFQTSLESQGVTPIEALGKPFDPYLHEAVRQDKGKEGIVIGELQKGYKINEKIIRPSKVVVGNGEAE